MNSLAFAPRFFRTAALTFGSLSLLFTAALPASSADYTYTNSSTSSTDNWNAGANWDAVPVSASDTRLTFISPNTTVFGPGLSIVSNNDIAGNFRLNTLDLQGSQPTASSTLTIQGNALELSSSGTSTPTVNFNALSPTANRLTFNVLNNVLLSNNTLFTGAGTANFNFKGGISGAGSLTKSSGSKVYLGSSVAANHLNDQWLYSGDINVNGGVLGSFTNSDILTKSKLTIAGGTYDGAGNNAVFSLFGTTGTMSAGTLTVNYIGTDPAAGFTGSIVSSSVVVSAGSGNLTLGASSGFGLKNVGTGTLTAVGYAGGSGISLGNPLATTKLTGTSGLVTGTSASTVCGTLSLAPSLISSTTDVTVSGQTVNVGGLFRYYGGSAFKLDQNGNKSLTYTAGNTALATSPISRQVTGSQIIEPVGGTSSLGSSTGVKFAILGASTAVPVLTYGLVNTAMVVVDNDSTRKADFLTYNGTGVSGDAGFRQATYTLNDTFVGSTNGTVVKNATAQTISSATSAFALRNDSSITINSGQTLTLGNPTVSGTASNSTSAAQTGLILNGGTIAGPGTLAFGTSEATIYTSNTGGTIGAIITGTGNSSNGGGGPLDAGATSLTKFGAGTLYLANTANTYTKATSINAGALDVGAITATALAGTTGRLALNGGVLQGNGTFARALGEGTNAVSWGVRHGNVLSGGGGGFAAKGADLTVAIGGIAAPTALTWGVAPSTTTHFLQDGGVLMFGSNSSTHQVDFRNNIDLGPVSPIYYRTVNVTSGPGGTDSVKLSGVISTTTGAEHGLLKTGTGTLILSGSNTYSGETAVSAGKLSINNNLALQNSAFDTSGAGAVTVTVTTPTFGGLKGSKNLASVITTGYGAVTSLTLNPGSGVTNLYSGVIPNGAAGMTLTKTGAGTQVLSGANTYTGGTVVSAGALLVNNLTGSGTGTGSVTINSGATLGGSGFIGGATTIADSGILSTGNSPSLLTFSNSLTLAGADSKTNFKIATGTRGANFDGVNVTGLLTYNGDLTFAMSGPIANGTYHLFGGSGGGTPTQTGSFDTVTFSSVGNPYSGSFTNSLGVWSLNSAGQTFVFNQATGDLVVTTEVAGGPRSSYPANAYVLPLGTATNIQTALDTYTTVVLSPGTYTGTAFTLRSGQKLYGDQRGTTIPAVTVEPGSKGSVLSHLTLALTTPTITFPASASAVTEGCVFESLTSGNGVRIVVNQGMLKDNLFLNINGPIKAYTSTGGWLRNNRFIRCRAQSVYPQIVLQGDAARSSYGNVFLWYNFLTPQGDATDINNQGDLSVVGVDAEMWNQNGYGDGTPAHTKHGLWRVGAMGPLRMFGINGGNNAPVAYRPNIYEVDADEFQLYNDTIGIGGGTLIDYVLGANNVRSILGMTNYTNKVWTSAATNPFRLKAFDGGGIIDVSTSVGGTPTPIWTLSSAVLPTAQQTEFRAMVVNPTRLGVQWEAPTYDSIPDPGGPNWNVNLATQPDSTAALQAMISSGSIIPAGTYYISSPLKVKRYEGLIGSGADNTVIIAKNATFDMVVAETIGTPANGSHSMWLSDVTLQGGLNGLHLEPIGLGTATGRTADGLHWLPGGGNPWKTSGPSVSVAFCYFNHVTFRNMANAGIFLDQFYGFDNNFMSYLNFVNCTAGVKQRVDPDWIKVGGENPTMMFIDKTVYYKCQFVANGIALDLWGERACTVDAWINCLFQNNTGGAAKMLNYAAPLFANCDFINNGGSRVMGNNGAQINCVSCGFEGGSSASPLFFGQVSLEGCTFTQGSPATKILYGNNVSNRIYLNNCTSNMPLGLPTSPTTSANGTLINTILSADTSAFNQQMVSIKAGVLTTQVPGTPISPKPQLLMGSDWATSPYPIKNR